MKKSGKNSSKTNSVKKSDKEILKTEGSKQSDEVFSKAPDTMPSKKTELSFPIVGLGASAGGIEALQDFFSNMPPESKIAFVIVLHLDPNYKSNLADLISRFTYMPVYQAEDNMRVEPNKVYIIPPNSALTIKDGLLKVETPVTPHGKPIDSFFCSLAEDQGPNAVSIVLSGTGSDGTIGIKEVKENGGMTMAQSAESAKYFAMPFSAISLGLIDFILPAKDMPIKLVEYVKGIEEMRRNKGSGSLEQETISQLDKICSLMIERTGHDFSNYKQGTLVRRIQRRMQVLGIDSAAAYVEYLQKKPQEQEADFLLNDILINVTQFFRDPKAFEALANDVIPQLFKNLDIESNVRIWVAGCASGEEAYSIAMLVREHLFKFNLSAQIQIFATDIDNQALDIARQGKYPNTISELISAERLARFFTKVGNKYQIAKDIREMCIFSLHDIIRDPPFSHLNLISCRNLFIYMQPDLQGKLTNLFHYALSPKGFLFLGSAENISSHPELFQTINKKSRIYQRNEVATPPLLEFPFSYGRESLKFQQPRPKELPTIAKEKEIKNVVEHILLHNYMPACVLINYQGDIIYFFGRTGKYLEPAVGKPVHNIFEMARKGLRQQLQSAVRKAIATFKEVIDDNVQIKTNGDLQLIQLIVRPASELGSESGLLMVIFQDKNFNHNKEKIDKASDATMVDEKIVQQMEKELKVTKENLQITIDELETANEELQSSNEELLSMNEELQSSNEELQTSKEEVQSINEELQIVNTEINKKVEELDSANSYIQNLFQSTPVAMIFLDNSLRIRNFTPTTVEVFRLIDADIGRSIMDITARFENGDLIKDIKEVLKTLLPIEREILVNGEFHYIKRITPYRTVQNVIDGVIITFLNVTDLKKAHIQVANLNKTLDLRIEELEAFFHVLPIGVALSEDPKSLKLRLNPSGYSILSGKSYIDKAICQIDLKNLDFHIYHKGKLLETDKFSIEELATKIPKEMGEDVWYDEIEIVRQNGSRAQFKLNASFLYDKSGTVRGGVATFIQVTEQEFRLRQLANSLPQLVWIMEQNGQIIYFNDQWSNYTGLALEKSREFNWGRIVHPDDLKNFLDKYNYSIKNIEILELECRLRKWDKVYQYHLIRALPQYDENNQIIYWFGTCTNIEDLVQTEQALKQANRHKDEFMAKLSHELRAPLMPLKNCLKILQQPNIESDQIENCIKIMDRQVRFLNSLINDLLDISRISFAKLRLNKKRLDIVELARTTAEDFRTGLASTTKTLEVNLPNEPIWISGDPIRLGQVINNLLFNADKYTADDEKIAVSVSLDADGKRVIISVKDTGAGMDEETLKVAFEPFSQAESAKDVKRGGLGLGLGLVKGLVELHGGTVAATSAGPGLGSEFTIYLPLVDVEQTTPQSESPVLTSAPKSKKLENRPARILLIEDNVDIVESMANMFRIKGYQVETAMNGKEGLEKAHQSKPEVILCDIGLPKEMNGYAVAKALRSDPQFSKTFLIAITGYGYEEDQQRALKAGFDLHITKPPNLDQLEQAINEHIQQL